MKQRIMTAMVLLAVFIPLLIYGGMPFQILGFVAVFVATLEMIAMRNNVRTMTSDSKSFTILFALWVGFDVGVSIWIAAILAVYIIFLIGPAVSRKELSKSDIGFMLFTILYIGMSFRALLAIRNAGLLLFLFLALVVIICDSAAYFIGKKFGKTKLIPTISPNKTVAGSVGGLLIATSTGVAFVLFTDLSSQAIILIPMSFILPVVSQIGDLLASKLKRKHKIKDFGKIFPGHGGVLDRVDSMMLAGLVLYLVMGVFTGA